MIILIYYLNNMNKKKLYSPSDRSSIDKFLVMDILSKATEIEKKGKKVFHLELGEPLKKTPKLVLAEAKKYLSIKSPGYTPSQGIIELREAISDYYKIKKISVNPKNIFITVGSSSAFLLTFLVSFDPGQTVLLFKPCYPAYRNILKSLNIKVIEVNQNNIEDIKRFKNSINGIILSSPNNPTGKIFSFDEIKYIYDFCIHNKISLISDEIYHGIEFSKKTISSSFFGQNSIIVNSFSKYFCMPGWRLGWVIIPDNLCEKFLRLAQNFFISSGSIAQYAAIKSFQCLKELNNNVKIYKKNRDLAFDKLKNTPWNEFYKTEGAFYIYLNLSKFNQNSEHTVKKILDETSIALTSGFDFDKVKGKDFIRLSFSCEHDLFDEAINNLAKWIKKNY